MKRETSFGTLMNSGDPCHISVGILDDSTEQVLSVDSTHHMCSHAMQ